MWNKLNLSMMFCQMVFGLSYYGVMVLLTRFFLEHLGYSEANTMMIVGAFSAVGTLCAIIGGVVADRFLGAYRTLTFSAFFFIIGYTCLVFGASLLSIPMSLAGIALASYSQGLLKPSYASLFKHTFSSAENFEACYPINYSINNLGSMTSRYLFPLLVLAIGYNGGFSLSLIAVAMAFVVLLLLRKSMPRVSTQRDQDPVCGKNWVIFFGICVLMFALIYFMFFNLEIGKIIVYVVGGAAILYLIVQIFRGTKSEGYHIASIVITTLLTIFFFLYYGQMMTSMTMVAINVMRGKMFGFIPWAPESLTLLNPLWCVVAGPVIALVFPALEKRGISFSLVTKIAIAFILVAVSFAILTLVCYSIGEEPFVRPEFFLLVYCFMSFGEVIVGSFVVAFYLSVAPKFIENFSVSMFYIAIAVAGIIGAVFSTNIALEKGQAVTQEIVRNVYGHYFLLLTILAVVMVPISLLVSAIVRKMLEAAKRCDEVQTAEAQ